MQELSPRGKLELLLEEYNVPEDLHVMVYEIAMEMYYYGAK